MGAPLAVWQRELGDSFDAVEPLLVVTDRLAERVPGARSDLPMRRVVDYRDGRFAAICDEEMSPRLDLMREQVVMRRVAEVKLRSALARALSLSLSNDAVTSIPGLLRIGTWEPTPAVSRPVLLAVASTATHLVDLIHRAMDATPGRLVLLTLTRARWSSQSETAAQSTRVTLIALDEVLEWHNGRWLLTPRWRDHLPSRDTGDEPIDPALRVDESTFTIWYGEKSCPMGNTVGFRAIRRLARRPGAYVSVEDLLDDAWGARRTSGAVQKAMTGIRKQFHKHGLHELEIDGEQDGHYALKISVQGKR